MITKASGMIRRRNEIMTERVHLRDRRDHAGIAEVINKFPSGQRRAGCRFNRDNIIIRFAAELLSHKRSNQSAQIRSAACTADHNVGLDAELVESCFGFKTDDTLMQNNLIQHRAEHIAIAFRMCRNFNCL